jgi:ABC-type multidrug transport system ATPase subunit
MVAIGGVTKRYGRTLALDAVSLAVQPNELFALLGPNGAGKTTLLHILCTILKPDSGSAAINSVDNRLRESKRRNSDCDERSAAVQVVFPQRSSE